jgi:type IV secretory pathway VirJ component
VIAVAALALALMAPAPATRIVSIHGHPQTVRVYGTPSARVAIVSSGDGGWIHLGPHVAQWLASQGWYVLGFDARAYLGSCTSGGPGLTTADIARDYQALLGLVDERTRPLLVGISEGAGLSLVAASDDAVRPRIGGVIAIGLGELNELAWRWRDAIIYVTKGVPREPLFRASAFLPRVSPAPLALVYSTHDEFVTPADQSRLSSLAGRPARTWVVAAADHRFSDHTPELDSTLSAVLGWIASTRRE